MKFPSLHSLYQSAVRAFLRFPIAILLAAKATVIGMLWTHRIMHESSLYGSGPSLRDQRWYWNAIDACYLGMLLSVAVTVWVEKRRGGERGGVSRGRPGLGMWLQLGVLALAGLYYWSMPGEYSDRTNQTTIQTIVLALGLHWLIAVVGFKRGEVNGFWNYNKQLFIRGLTTWLYTIVLYVGIAVALLAIDHLLNITIREEVYTNCWWGLGGVFSVWFFLAGFPRSYENPAVIDDYPKGLKIFTQYILLSLVTLYLVILYAYMLKIIFTAHWPEGWVAWLVMAFAVLGVLSLLLIYPLRNDENNTWIRSYSRFFYFAMLPLIVLLWCAIYKRVAPYGVTEQRYYLLALAGWLLFISVYFLVSRVKDIRWVPLSLCILAFLSCWGPWGAFSVSLKSQEHRLIGLLEKYGAIKDGKVAPVGDGVKVPGRDRVAISSTIEYICDEHGYIKLQPWFRQSLDSLMKKKDWVGRGTASGQTDEIMKLMNIHYAESWLRFSDTSAAADVVQTHYFSCDLAVNTEATSTGGANFVGQFSLYSYADSGVAISVGEQSLRIIPDMAHSQIHLRWVGGSDAGVADLGPTIRAVKATGKDAMVKLKGDQCELAIAGSGLSGKIVLTDARGTKTGDSVTFTQISGIVLFSKK